MNRHLLPLTLCLLLTGCAGSGESSVRDPAALTDRQIEILQAQGLPTDYTQLTPKQQHTVTRIEALLSETEEKYGEEFIYVKYIPLS